MKLEIISLDIYLKYIASKASITRYYFIVHYTLSYIFKGSRWVNIPLNFSIVVYNETFKEYLYNTHLAPIRVT